MALNVVGSKEHLQLLHDDVELRARDIGERHLRVYKQSLTLGPSHIACRVTKVPNIDVQIPGVTSFGLDNEHFLSVLIQNTFLVPASELDDGVISDIGVHVKRNCVVSDFALRL